MNRPTSGTSEDSDVGNMQVGSQRPKIWSPRDRDLGVSMLWFRLVSSAVLFSANDS